MARLLFKKTGNAIWISHLDLMRLFQRAFKRAGLPLKHTQGFNPRPSVSIALPLSVGVESCCELLDFDIDGDAVFSCDEIKSRLNCALVKGVQVIEVYDDGRKLKYLSYLRCAVTLEYNNGFPEDTKEQLESLFRRERLLVTKKSKNGPIEQDIIPMIRELNITVENNAVVLVALICCQNPSMNPLQLVSAIEHYLPDYVPDHVKCIRHEIYDEEVNIFR